MTGKEIYKIWAPIGAKWVEWVRPVPFVIINDSFKSYEFNNSFTIPSISYIDKFECDTAIIVDLPGEVSVEEGLALANIGFRPIPIYNGTNEQEGAIATVDNKIVTSSLIRGASILKKISLSNNAPPAFLLDSNRMHRYKMDESVFDNSWDIYVHDLPSVKYFLENGINKIIIRGETIQKDLKKILYKFQKNGIKILFTNGYEIPKEITIKKQISKNNI